MMTEQGKDSCEDGILLIRLHIEVLTFPAVPHFAHWTAIEAEVQDNP
jgi:hypothetical protein